MKMWNDNKSNLGNTEQINERASQSRFTEPLHMVAMKSRSSMAQTSSEQWSNILNMDSSSHWGLIIAPGQEENGDNLGMYFYLL